MKTSLLQNAFQHLLLVTAACFLGASTTAAEFHEDFESCRVGEFPWPWIAHANAASDPTNNCVTMDPTGRQKQVLQVYGSEPRNWSALVFHRCDFGKSFELKYKVYLEKEFQGSPGYVGCQLRSQPNWEAPVRGLVGFDKQGDIKVGERTPLAHEHFDYGRWHSVRLSYQRKENQVFINAWVDGRLVGSSTEPLAKVEAEMKYLAFDGRGRFYIDDVELR